MGASSGKEVIFTSGSTEGLNLISYSWAKKFGWRGWNDSYNLRTSCKYSSMALSQTEKNVSISWVDPDKNGNVPLNNWEKNFEKYKMVCFTHMSNVFGSTLNVKEICTFLRSKGIVSVVDGSQAAAHLKINVKDIGWLLY